MDEDYEDNPPTVPILSSDATLMQVPFDLYTTFGDVLDEIGLSQGNHFISAFDWKFERNVRITDGIRFLDDANLNLTCFVVCGTQHWKSPEQQKRLVGENFQLEVLIKSRMVDLWPKYHHLTGTLIPWLDRNTPNTSGSEAPNARRQRIKKSIKDIASGQVKPSDEVVGTVLRSDAGAGCCAGIHFTLLHQFRADEELGKLRCNPDGYHGGKYIVCDRCGY
jgi:hypothetical protein